MRRGGLPSAMLIVGVCMLPRLVVAQEVGAGVDLALVESAPDPVETQFFRNATVVSGLTLVAAGTGLMAWGIANTNTRPAVFCLEPTPSGQDCGETRWLRTGFDGDAFAAQDPNGNGVPIVPLGYSLIGTGLIWSLGTLLIDEEHTPWIPVVAGLLAGSLSLGITMALEPESPFDRPI